MKPSGTPHLGNYLGMIRPAIALQDEGYESFHFIASYHALTTLKDRKQLRQHTLSVAATFLALGLDPAKTTLYRQQDVPEVTELAHIFNCITSMGVLRRAHAYKAACERNGGEEGINVGLFTYPVLMAADILAFDTDVVPVGRDQAQHIEIARDLAQRFNNHFGDTLVVPEARTQAEVATVVGTDGRKMSKSYDNTIGIFLPRKKLRKAIMGIATDSTPVADPKEPYACNVYMLYQAIATPEQAAALRTRYLFGGMGYGHAKQELFDVLDPLLTEPRERYNALMTNPDEIMGVLEAGAAKARPVAREVVDRVRDAVGL
jgi:tryptophanyl-tRNA synthetase